MKISNINLHALRNDGHFQFHTEFKDLVTKQNAETLKIKPHFELYLPLYDREDEALKKVNKSIFTEQIQEADKARDDIYIGMVEMNTAALKHFNPETQEAAKHLKILFETYGNVAKKPLNEQTSAVYNILQELEGKFSADTVSVGIDGWVAELKKRNTAFAELMKDRFDEGASKSDIVTKDARIELDNAYKVIVERINALIVVDGEAIYEQFVKTLNTIIAKYSITRKGKPLAKVEEETVSSI